MDPKTPSQKHNPAKQLPFFFVLPSLGSWLKRQAAHAYKPGGMRPDVVHSRTLPVVSFPLSLSPLEICLRHACAYVLYKSVCMCGSLAPQKICTTCTYICSASRMGGPSVPRTPARSHSPSFFLFSFALPKKRMYVCMYTCVAAVRGWFKHGRHLLAPSAGLPFEEYSAFVSTRTQGSARPPSQGRRGLLALAFRFSYTPDTRRHDALTLFTQAHARCDALPSSSLDDKAPTAPCSLPTYLLVDPVSSCRLHLTGTRRRGPTRP